MTRRQKRKRNHPPDLPAHTYVDDPAGWQQTLQQISGEPRIAIDLEANSMYAYQEEVCLIQMSIPGRDYIVDPLADIDLTPFGQIIQDPAVEKVFHAAEYDLMLLKRQFGWKLQNLFDTMWAARILGYDRFGLASLLEDLYHVKVNKRYQRANWCKRPLSPAQLTYAQADTHYLLPMREHFIAELEQAGRMVEAQEIFEEQTHITLPDTDFDSDDFWSINGVRHLSSQGKAILKALTIYRDREAQYRDRPHFKVLHDKTLLELAERKPRTLKQLRPIHGMSSGQIRRYGDEILRIIKANKSITPPKRPRRNRRPPDQVIDRYERLHTWRKKRGRARGVESDVIVSKDTLWRLARANPQSREELAQIEGLGPWRLQEYGDEILQVLSR